MPPGSPPGEVTAVGIGLVFCGMTTGGRGGGGMWAGLLCPLDDPSYDCWPGAAAKLGGGGRDMEGGEARLFMSAMSVRRWTVFTSCEEPER